MILNKAKLLREDAYFAIVYINKWLSEEEMKKVKLLRKQCDALNQAHSTSKNGRKQFVVIGRKIMQRSSNGRLQIYNSVSSSLRPPPPPSNYSSSESALLPSKNLKGGSRLLKDWSQAAPSK
jgi:hypothetical protein